MDLRERLQSAFGSQYTLDREIGRGGTAIVFLAEDAKHQRPVALKVLVPELASAVGSDRFLREIKLAAQLTHPHILPLHDSGIANGILYYVMPFINGESLRERLERERELPVDDAIRLACEIAGALDYAHKKGVVHRDIKPENILLAGDHAMVLDFGIGKMISAAAETTSITASGVTIGTPAYMSPEQAAGETFLDGRSDIYSLAIMLYEMLAGAPPFTGATAQATIAARFVQAVRPIHPIRPEVLESTDQAIAIALATAPVDRYSTAAEFSRALRQRPPGGQTPTYSTAIGSEPRPSGSSSVTPEPRRAPALRSIAVLPFTNISPDTDTEYLSDGITEELINALTRLRGIHVAARTSAFAFKGKNLDLRTVGEKLNVRMVLEGSVRRAGNRLRVNCQLTNVADNYNVWSDRYDRQIEDVFAIEDEISRAIVDHLSITVLGEPETSGPRRAENFEAYDLYLKGRHYFNNGSIRHALDSFERAARRDPKLAKSYAGIADCYFALANLSYLSPREGYERARSAAQRALELDDSLADAHAAMAIIKCYYDWDWPEAQREFERALALNPGLANARYFYSLALSSHGRPAEALEQGERAIELDPVNTHIYTGVARAHLVTHRYAEALDVLSRSLERGQDVSATHAWMAVAHLELGSHDAAMTEAKRSLSLAEIPIYVALLGYVSARAGRREEAMQVLASLSARSNDVAVFQAWVYVGLGDNSLALDWLERAYEERSDWLVIIAALPVCDPLRREPRFTSLVAKLGIELSANITITSEHRT
ncbi:MAG: protein kinase [Gemmatimonadaceae bacterium]